MAGLPARPDASLPALVMLDEIDSTNSEAMRRAAAGERGPIWICARSQSQGRGRSGRSWMSPPGTLAATLLFSPGGAVGDLPGLALVAGVAVVDAIVAEAADAGCRDLPVRLKWPNDVLIGPAKVSGLLVESSTFGGDLVAVVGIGINIEARPSIDGRAITSLAEHGMVSTPDALAARLRRAMASTLAVWDQGLGFGRIRDAWLARALPVGTPLSVNAGGGPVTGTFAGLDRDGALLLQDSLGLRRRFTFGDVTLAAPAKA